MDRGPSPGKTNIFLSATSSIPVLWLTQLPNLSPLMQFIMLFFCYRAILILPSIVHTTRFMMCSACYFFPCRLPFFYIILAFLFLTIHQYPRYAASSNLSFHLSFAQIFSRLPCSEIQSVYTISLLLSETKFRTHREPQANDK